MRAGVMKELGPQWLVVFYNHVCCHPNFVVNGFKEAGITDALQIGVVTPPSHEGTLLDDDETKDPFLDIHSDKFSTRNPLLVCY